MLGVHRRRRRSGVRVRVLGVHRRRCHAERRSGERRHCGVTRRPGGSGGLKKHRDVVTGIATGIWLQVYCSDRDVIIDIARRM